MKQIIFFLGALFSLQVHALENEIVVSSLEKLFMYLNQDGNTIRMTPSIYKMKDYLNEDSIAQRVARSEREYINFRGNNNIFIFEGVTFEIDTELRQQLRHPIHTNEIQITKEEAERLAKHWNQKMDFWDEIPPDK